MGCECDSGSETSSMCTTVQELPRSRERYLKRGPTALCWSARFRFSRLAFSREPRRGESRVLHPSACSLSCLSRWPALELSVAVRFLEWIQQAQAQGKRHGARRVLRENEEASGSDQ